MKIDIHPWYLFGILGPFVGEADDPAMVQHYRYLDPDNEMMVREAVRERIVPYYRSWDERSQTAAKLALQYLLSCKRDECAYIVNAALMPWDVRDSPALCEWIWSELFGEADISLPEAQYTIVDDLAITNTIRVRAPGV